MDPLESVVAPTWRFSTVDSWFIEVGCMRRKRYRVQENRPVYYSDSTYWDPGDFGDVQWETVFL